MRPNRKYIATIKTIFLFYRNPYSYLNKGLRDSVKERVILMRDAFAMCISSTLAIVLLITVIEMILKYGFNTSIAKNLNQNRNEFKSANPSGWVSFIKICLLGPFNEEFLFRLLLITKSQIWNVIIFLILIGYLILNLFHLQISFLWYHVTIVLIFVAVLIGNGIDHSNYQPIFEKKNYNYLCWVLILGFGMIHLGNFVPLNWSVFYLYPVYILPQFMYGIVFSYLAIRYNSMIWPFLLHAGINSMAEIYKFLNGVS